MGPDSQPIRSLLVLTGILFMVVTAQGFEYCALQSNHYIEGFDRVIVAHRSELNLHADAISQLRRAFSMGGHSLYINAVWVSDSNKAVSYKALPFGRRLRTQIGQKQGRLYISLEEDGWAAKTLCRQLGGAALSSLPSAVE